MVGQIEIVNSEGEVVCTGENEINRTFRERVLNLMQSQPNLTITNLADYTGSTIRSIRFTGIAYGTDDTAAAVGDTTLGTETLRKELSSRSRAVQGTMLAVGRLETDELNGINVREVGLLVPAHDSDTLADMILATRVNVNFTKTTGEYTVNYRILW